ncbi:guanylate cyclase 32E-like, partial [Ptychodera flava]|uniref:guanylate cyclase 32E-like n=1 Tax=Ptychodera flava TaxID=63121 RepID=UPI00396A8D88
MEFRTLLTFPLHAIFSPLSAEQSSGAGFLIGYDKVNKNDNLLSGHTITFDLLPTFCSVESFLGSFTDMVYASNYSALIGPVCSDEANPAAVLANHWNTAYLCAGCSQDSSFKHKEVFGFSTLLRSMGSFEQIAAYITGAVFQHFEWDTFGLIAETSQSLWFPVARAINVTVMNSHNMTIGRYRSYSSYKTSDEEMFEIIKDVSSKSR